MTDKTQMTPEAPQLSDEAWKFIKENADSRNGETEHYSFDGDWGNWNWLWAEIYKRCVNVKAD